MQNSPAPRLIAALIAAAAVLAATWARADELAEASALLRSGQRTQALAKVEAVLASRPQEPRARFLQGLIFAEQGKSDAAIAVFRKLTEDHPELPEPHNNLAVIYASRGEYDKARVALEQSIRTHPSYATAYENLGDVYAKLASQAYDRALKLDSNNADAQNKLALVRDLVGDSPRAGRSPEVARDAPAPRVAPVVRKEAVVAAVAPVPVATPAPAPSTGSSGALEAVATWAQAWSRQDVDAYLASYSPAFRPPGGESREAWERTRRARVSSPKQISVQVESPRMRSVADDVVRVTFRQHYRSDRFKASSTKTLVMERAADGRWRIAEERIGR
jgi:tetratricopeptide (TPR) repeat protein